ncbi:hypothetical protein [Flavobacterium akiainvivens]|uniref:hypothetical protein n=1 Tax=Flavobacterium akiainvivens TaxID=1202724 RepID=UPI0006C845D2|nr:hypothetical protein [Flavobacterium akiainvivens]SFQ78189.1 hypothetical protein SAMN05444144_1298 [Flavobacterium akiainvivens]
MANEFGWFLYLHKENDYKIVINGTPLNYFEVIAETDEKNVTIGDFDFKISYLRWNEKIGDKYYYYFLNLDKKQVYRKHTSFNNKTEDFHHSLYIVSNYFDNFKATKSDQPTLDFIDKNQTDSTFKAIVDILNAYVGEKEKLFIRDLKAKGLIESYNKNKVFPEFKSNPYEQLRKQDLESVVKELYSVQPKIFQKLTVPQSKTIVGFLNLLLDTEQRENVLEIVDNVVKLSDEERTELANVLKKSKLSHITALIKFLESRFNIVQILKALIYDLEEFTNERDHIQKVIEENYWLFGEQYHLVSADKNFETVLNNYLAHLETYDKKPDLLKLEKKDKLRRPDIFICQKTDIPDANSELTIEENIMVELKRPDVEIGKKQFSQIEDYLGFIVNEDNFNSQLRNWKFIIIGKSIDSYIKGLHENQKDKGKKFLVQAIGRYEIYAMTWDDLFRMFDSKHKHLIDKLDFKSSVIEELQSKGIMLNRDASDALTEIAKGA